jgi:alpha-tubulin suppressor-like RCC1 family protein
MNSALSSAPEPVYSFAHESKDAKDTDIPLIPCKSHIIITSNKCETLFISPTGDVLSSRCRNTPYPPSALNSSGAGKERPYRWTDEISTICCDSDSTSETIPACIPPWNHSRGMVVNKGPGLKGGAPLPAELAPVRHQSRRVMYERGAVEAFSVSNNTPSIDAPLKEFPNVSIAAADRSPKACRSLPMHFDSSYVFDEFSIVPIKSFDYSQFNEGGNDMLPDSRYEDVTTGTFPKVAQQQLFHGIPSFLPFFSNIKVRHVSAHPLGAHVLLISQPGILYSYGLNIHGQLGIGILSSPRDVHQGYVMKPKVVTPLLENGGKAVVCSAGVTHSLVVVEMEEQRIQKAQVTAEISSSQEQRPEVLRIRNQSSDNSSCHSTHSMSTIVKHHQVYGFGRNDKLKMGLVSPKQLPPATPTTAPHLLEEMECVPLPRRVALRCSVVHRTNHHDSDFSSTEGEGAMPAMGIFAIAASVEHSAALIRRTSGHIELYTWGNATFGALGLAEPETLDGALVPSSAAFCIVPVPTLVAGLSHSANPEVQSQSFLRNGEFPVKLSLSRCCSFVVTNIGRCFSFGTSEDGMLGLGRDVTETHTPMEIVLPVPSRGESIMSVNAGAMHVSVCTSVGNVYSWGARGHCGFPIQRTTPVTPVQQPRKPPTMKGPTPIEELTQFEWSPRQVLFSSSSMDRSRNESDQNNETVKIVLVHAGNDCSFFVTERGVVLSSGKNSGRLGQGETDHDVTNPKPLFGGLHLFQQENLPVILHHSKEATLATKFVHSRRMASA